MPRTILPVPPLQGTIFVNYPSQGSYPWAPLLDKISSDVPSSKVFLNSEVNYMNSSDSIPLETNCASVKALCDQGADFLFLDCREPDEYEIVSIRGTTLLPMSQLLERAGELESHRDRHIVVVCHVGGRSMRVTRWLRQHGFAKAQNLTGGIDQWALEIEPGMVRY